MSDTKNSTPDQDSLDSLSLSMIPLASNALKTARLVKNARMETAVEIHSDPISGSWQIAPEEAASQLSLSPKDQQIITQLAKMNSYDVYSLKTNLKKIGVEVSQPGDLELSDEMKNSLTAMSVQFTRPLIEKIFGNGSEATEGVTDLQKILRDPDVSRVRKNLDTISRQTGIALNDIPKFFEEYNEVFLSVAYYEYLFNQHTKEIDRFFKWIVDLQSNREVTSSSKTVNSCRKVTEFLQFLVKSIQDRFARFDGSFEVFWGNINKQSFEALRRQIEENHSTMGAALCGLDLKLRDWAKNFPDSNVGGPATRAKYVMTEMEPGLEGLVKIEQAAKRKIGQK